MTTTISEILCYLKHNLFNFDNPKISRIIEITTNFYNSTTIEYAKKKYYR